jgi:hypothetical protein
VYFQEVCCQRGKLSTPEPLQAALLSLQEKGNRSEKEYARKQSLRLNDWLNQHYRWGGF